MTQALEIRDVAKHFGGVAAVDGVSLDVERGSITSLIGPNGAGKTTLFNVVAGVLRPERGTITFEGRRIDRSPAFRIARLGLLRTFQSTRAFGRISVLGNVLLAAQRHPGEQLSRVLATTRHVRAHERELERRARELLEFVRLDHLADDYAATLSGGQRKLLEFARVLMAQPRMVLLDEPMAGVNPTLGNDLLTRMLELRAERGITFLLVEHDLEAVMRVSDRVVVMNEGVVIADGEPAAVRHDERVVDAYLGVGGPDRRR